MERKCSKPRELQNNKQPRDKLNLTGFKKQKMKPTRNSWFNK